MENTWPSNFLPWSARCDSVHILLKRKMGKLVRRLAGLAATFTPSNRRRTVNSLTLIYPGNPAQTMGCNQTRYGRDVGGIRGIGT